MYLKQFVVELEQPAELSCFVGRQLASGSAGDNEAARQQRILGIVDDRDLELDRTAARGDQQPNQRAQHRGVALERHLYASLNDLFGVLIKEFFRRIRLVRVPGGLPAILPLEPLANRPFLVRFGA
jgi:hypothetical protein